MKGFKNNGLIFVSQGVCDAEKEQDFLGSCINCHCCLSGTGLFWFFVEPAVDFWLNTGYLYQKVGNSWDTVTSVNNSIFNGTLIPFYCKNYGLLPATFDISVIFTGASFSNQTQLQYQKINGSAAKFDFTLGGGQEKTVNVYFNITSNDNFVVSLSFETNQGLLRIVDAQKFGSQPWLQSYRELHYGLTGDGRLEPVRLVPSLIM